MLYTYHKRCSCDGVRPCESPMDLQQLRPLAAVGISPVRHATPNDYPAIVHLGHKAGVFTPAELESLRADLDACDANAGDRLLVHDSAGAGALGFIQFSPAPITDGTWYVYWIAVAKDTHGQGIGAALLAEAERCVHEAGGRQIVIETSASPLYEATRRFYLRRGYDQVARVPDYYSAGDDKCIFLKKV